MATAKKTDVGDDVTTNTSKNVQQHDFSGQNCEIKLFKAEAGESSQQYVGLNNYNAILHRDKWVTIPVEVANHLESLTYSVLEPDETDPDNRAKDTWQERARFPMQRRG